MELLKEQRHFLVLFTQSKPSQRKALLQTITKDQLRALSQIAHNIIKLRIKLSSAEKSQLKRERRLLYILGDRSLGYERKSEAIVSKQRFVYILLKIVLPYLKPILQ